MNVQDTNPTTSGQHGADAIIDAESRRCRALVDVDLATLDALFDDDLVHIHGTGEVHDKARLLRHIAERRAFVNCERRDLIVRRYDDLAILSGPICNTTRVPGGAGTAETRGIATQILRRHGGTGQWRFIHFQFTRLEPREPSFGRA